MDIIVYYIKLNLGVGKAPELKIIGRYFIPETLPIGKVDEFVASIPLEPDTLRQLEASKHELEWYPTPHMNKVEVSQKLVNVYTINEK